MLGNESGDAKLHLPLFGKSQRTTARVLDTLRELGLSENTFVLFTSDNGGTPRAVNKPLRGNKGSTWEGGIRVPTIAW